MKVAIAFPGLFAKTSEMANRPGVYCILNVTNGKRYIGSSADAPKRLYRHRWMLQCGDHDNRRLQRSWKRDGDSAFSFAVIEWCSRDDLLKREQLWINETRSADGHFGYNICKVAGTRAGVPQPASVSEKMRAFHTGKLKTAEQRAKMSVAAKGRAKTDDHKQRLRESAVRQFDDPGARARAAQYGAMGSGFSGKKHTEETKQKLRDAHHARWDGVPRKARKKRDQRKPPDQLLKRGPKPGLPRADRRSMTVEQVKEIRRLKAEGVSYSALSRQFGLNTGPLHRLVTGKTYKVLETEERKL